MTYEIRAADGHVYLAHTEVGDGPARVCLDIDHEDEPTSVEPEDEYEFA